MNGRDQAMYLDGQQVFIKHGSYYVRVHPSRIKLVHQVVDQQTVGRDNQEVQGDING